MGKPAARVGDFHTCPKTTSKVPHVGGPIVSGSTNVFINGLPAAREGDKIVCCGPPDTIKGGSATVFINGKPAARMGDGTAHGGKIIVGSSNVFIGDSAGGTSGSATAEPDTGSSSSDSNNSEGTEANTSKSAANNSTNAGSKAQHNVAAPVSNEPKWIKIRAYHNDKWQTPIHAENIDVEAKGAVHKAAVNL